MMKLVVISALLLVQSYGFQIQPKIMNGFDSKPSDFPHYVLLVATSEQGSSMCGGSILSDRYAYFLFHHNQLHLANAEFSKYNF